MNWRLINSDAIEGLRQLPDASVHCVVTSPPYFGLRDYGTAQWEGGNAECDHLTGRSTRTITEASAKQGTNQGSWASETRGQCPKCGAHRIDQQIGLESTPDEYVARLVEVFREVRRVLRDDGTLWINIGDSYANDGKWGGETGGKQAYLPDNDRKRVGREKRKTGLKPKDLIGIPWRLAFALQADGWWLRSDIIWSKPNGMTESVEDRPTKAHEYIFLLTKRARYFYDNEAIKEPAVTGFNGSSFTSGYDHATKPGLGAGPRTDDGKRNKRSVWTLSTRANPEAHFATFPKALPEICIKAGTSEKGCCSKCGAPWVRIVEKALTAHDGKTESDYAKGSTANRLALLRQAARERGEEYANTTKTIGWKPTCKCEAGEPQDCTVLDPFTGTSTTGVAALLLGRRFIGIELNSEYAKISERRLRNAELQAYGSLFLAANGGAQ